MFMSETPHEIPQADPARDDPAEARPDETEFYLRKLREAAEIGMRLMNAAAAELAADKAVLAFHRLSRDLRLYAALSNKLQNDRLEREKQVAATENAEVQQHKKRKKRQLENLVADAIELMADREVERVLETDPTIEDESEIVDRESFHDALTERLEQDDIERDLARCPTGELVERICRDLGIDADWDMWRDSYWAREEARLEMPGSPYARPAVVPETEETPMGRAGCPAAVPSSGLPSG